MDRHEFDVVVVGCGIAGLATAVSALEAGARVAILERAPKEERGGQTRYTEAYFRMKSHHEVTDDFSDYLAENSAGYVDPTLIAEMSADRQSWPSLVRGLGYNDADLIDQFATQAPPTVAWLTAHGIRFEFLPTQFITKSQPRLLPVGGGFAMVEALAAHAETHGGRFFYDTAARELAVDEEGRVTGVKAVGQGNRQVHFHARGGVVLACGGFEGSTEMLSRYLGPRSSYLRPVCRGGYYNKGEGIQMALAIGAAPCGDFGSYHAEPIDPRSGITEPSVFIFPYGILVNKDGERFTDEGPGTVDQYYERVTRRIYEQREGIAYAILDARLADVPNWRVALRTDQPPIAASSIEELAKRLDVPAERLAATVAQYNAACVEGKFDPLALDGLATRGLSIAKSNWARPIDQPPFHAYPIISANVFTFGGLKADREARVLNKDGDPIDGLYVAGETLGTYYKNYTGATSVLKGAVFGKLAGAHAARRAEGAVA
ncbi:MAG: FAD-dependent tricarballylate dehydrogenase TcuA [Lautropia sp.]